MPKLRKFIRKHELPDRIGCGPTKLQEIIDRDPTFPKLFPLTDGGRAKVVDEDELAAWMEARLVSRDL
jgi:hypothetical protein